MNFSQPVLDSSFTTGDVLSFTGPSDSITATSISKISTTQYLVNFASQTAAGEYALTLSSDITKADATKLDQDWDGTAGETTDDKFHVVFYVAAAAGATGPVRRDTQY